MPLRLLVFDCDGVLLDSVPAKTRAFARLAEPFGSAATEAFVRYHEEHGGVSRFEKFAWFFRTIEHREITDAEKEDWGKQFAHFCEEEIRSCPLIAGARDVLSRWHGKIPLYVCSGAPQEEQTRMLEEHGLLSYFDGVFGSPPPKKDLLVRILEQTKIEPSQALMVGDASTDRDAASAAGTLFYGVGERMQSSSYPWHHDLTQLSSYVETLLSL